MVLLPEPNTTVEPVVIRLPVPIEVYVQLPLTVIVPDKVRLPEGLLMLTLGKGPWPLETELDIVWSPVPTMLMVAVPPPLEWVLLMIISPRASIWPVLMVEL